MATNVVNFKKKSFSSIVVWQFKFFEQNKNSKIRNLEKFSKFLEIEKIAHITVYTLCRFKEKMFCLFFLAYSIFYHNKLLFHQFFFLGFWLWLTTGCVVMYSTLYGLTGVFIKTLTSRHVNTITKHWLLYVIFFSKFVFLFLCISLSSSFFNFLSFCVTNEFLCLFWIFVVTLFFSFVFSITFLVSRCFFCCLWLSHTSILIRNTYLYVIVSSVWIIIF